MNLEGVRLQNIKLAAQKGKEDFVSYSFLIFFDYTILNEFFDR